MRRRRGALRGAQLGRARARIGRNLGSTGDDRALCPYFKARRGMRDFGLMPRAGGNLAALGEEILHNAVFQRVEGDDNEPAARLQYAFSRGKRLVKFVE